MALLLHELKQNKLSLIIWSAAIAFMLGVCVLIYPGMAEQMKEISDMLTNMGALSDAFGLDQLGFTDFMGYFALEFGEMLCLGGGLFAAILGTGMLAKEEKDHTAEFLLTHPISRNSVLTSKLLAMLIQIILLNFSTVIVTIVCILAIGEQVQAGTLALLFLAALILQLEIAAITFGLSSLMRRGAIGVGLGLALGCYFMNLMANLSEEMKFLKFITPYGYADSAQIASEGSIQIKYLAIGLAVMAASIALAYKKYTSKDIA
jgi:ABC-2 type transport system permease protein